MQLKLNDVVIDMDFVPDEIAEKLTAAVTGGWDTAIAGLKTKNADLIAVNKQLKQDVQNASDNGSAEIQIRLADTTEELNEARNALKVAEHNNGQMAKKLEQAEGLAGEFQGKHDDLIKTTALTDALGVAGVKDPHLLEAARALLLGNVRLGEDNTALYGDKPLADSLKEWAESDRGKAFVSAGGNAGGGAGGSGGAGGTVDNPFKPGEHYNLTAQMKLQAENPELAKQLQSDANSGHYAPAPATAGGVAG